jgi:hypothetical protein
MNRLSRIAASAIFLLFVSYSVNAQMGRPNFPDFHGVWNPVVGAGADYEIHSKGEKNSLEIFIAGKENVGGKDAYWLEMAMNNAKMGGDFVIKNLMVIDAGNTQSTKTIMQMPGRPPMEMPAGMSRSAKTPQPTDVRTQSEDVGSESVTTSAGTFQCEHYRMKDGSGDAWVSTKVAPWGLVKYQGKDTTMVVTKVITDAQDKITGTPQPFNPMMMGQRPQ